jgi:hypothetical protein
MKKLIVLLVLAVAVSTTAFALPDFHLSAGLGGSFVGAFTTIDGESEEGDNFFGGGVFGFFDATYAELDLGVRFGANDGDPSTSLTYFSFGVLGKFPIGLTEKLVLFPALGIDFDLLLGSNTDGESNSRADWEDFADLGDETLFSLGMDRLSLDVGGGVDFYILKQLYLRGEVLWAFQLNYAEDSKQFTHGPVIKLGVGYTFF